MLSVKFLVGSLPAQTKGYGVHLTKDSIYTYMQYYKAEKKPSKSNQKSSLAKTPPQKNPPNQKKYLPTNPPPNQPPSPAKSSRPNSLQPSHYRIPFPSPPSLPLSESLTAVGFWSGVDDSLKNDWDFFLFHYLPLRAPILPALTFFNGQKNLE